MTSKRVREESPSPHDTGGEDVTTNPIAKKKTPSTLEDKSLKLKVNEKGNVNLRFFAKALEFLYPDDWVTGNTNKSVKRVKAIVNSGRLDDYLGRIKSGDGNTEYLDSELSRYLKGLIDDPSRWLRQTEEQSKASKDFKEKLEMIVAKKNFTIGSALAAGDTTDQSGAESEGGGNATAKWREVLSQLVVTTMQALVLGGGNRVQNKGAARVFLSFLLKAFCDPSLPRDHRLRAARHLVDGLSKGHNVPGPDAQELAFIEKDVATTNVEKQDKINEVTAALAVGDEEVMGLLLVNTVFEGGAPVRKQFAEEAAIQFKFMRDVLPKDPVPRRFVQNAFDATKAWENKANPNTNTPSLSVLKPAFFGEEEAAVHLPERAVDPPSEAAGVPPPELVSLGNVLMGYLEAQQQLSSEFAAKAHGLLPNMGFAKYIIQPQQPTAQLPPTQPTAQQQPVKSTVPEPSSVFNAKNMCKNREVRKALSFSLETDRDGDLETALEGTLLDPTTTAEKAGAASFLEQEYFTILGYLGKGSYNNVYIGNYKGMPVALKVTQAQASHFLKEIYRGLCNNALIEDDYVVRILGFTILKQKDLDHKTMVPTDILHIVIVEELGNRTLADLQKSMEDSESLPNTGGGEPVLRKYWKRIMRKRMEAVVKYLFQIVQALVELHKRNIYHRDIKPENLLEVNSKYKIGDWGTAKKKISPQVNKKQTEKTGTELYSPPEAENQIYGTFTDAHSYGLVVYEMFVGRLPPTKTSTNGNEKWYTDKHAKYVFQVEFGGSPIGTMLKELIQGLTKHDHRERWSTDQAMTKLKNIIESFQRSK